MLGEHEFQIYFQKDLEISNFSWSTLMLLNKCWDSTSSNVLLKKLNYQT